MIRFFIIILYIIFIAIFTIFDAIFCLFLSLFDKDKIKIHSMQVVQHFMKVVIFISGVKVNVIGLDNLKSLNDEKSIFIISNHRGFFDIITGYPLFTKYTGIVAKDSLSKVPLLHYWMKRIDCLFLKRDDIRDGMKMVINAINNINNGVSMWIFPEGTRCKSSDPTEVLEFKAGTFKIAEKTDSYILPMSFKNTEKAFENQKPWVVPTDIYINIGKPYKISELNDTNRENIAEFSRNIMKKLLMEGK